MKTIRVTFYKPDWDKKILDNAISFWGKMWNWMAWWLGLICSHVELWTPDEDGNFEYSDIICGESYTSTMGQAGDTSVNGTVKRAAHKVFHTRHRWFYFEIPVQDLGQWKQEMDELLGKKYDKRAIGSFFLPWRLHRDDADICSEFAHTGIFKAANPNDSNKLTMYWIEHNEEEIPSPMRLAWWLYKAGFRPQRLDGEAWT